LNTTTIRAKPRQSSRPPRRQSLPQGHQNHDGHAIHRGSLTPERGTGSGRRSVRHLPASGPRRSLTERPGRPTIPEAPTRLARHCRGDIIRLEACCGGFGHSAYGGRPTVADLVAWCDREVGVRAPSSVETTLGTATVEQHPPEMILRVPITEKPSGRRPNLLVRRGGPRYDEMTTNGILTASRFH
jgi:hypothetical protein